MNFLTTTLPLRAYIYPANATLKNIFSSKDYKGVGLIQFFTPMIVEYIKKNLDITKTSL